MTIEVPNRAFQKKADQWKLFLKDHLKLLNLNYKIIFDQATPLIFDEEGRKLRINFETDMEYLKHKTSITKEPLSRALGGGKKGLRVLDLSAGLAIDSIFLVQLGYQVIALERNPLIYLALEAAYDDSSIELQKKINFIFSDANNFIKQTNTEFDVCYFDPMFPQKKKSALAKQEMIMFKNLVGDDADAQQVLEIALDSGKFKRCVVKRPLKADALLRPTGSIKGKIIRFDIY